MSVLTIPAPRVVATLVPRNAPIKLSDAAMTTATRGLSTLVETTVAMALAQSWAPLVKSKISATTTMSTSSTGTSNILEHHLFQRVAEIGNHIHGTFDALVNLAPEDQFAHFLKVGDFAVHHFRNPCGLQHFTV